jgi:hypothetical protein
MKLDSHDAVLAYLEHNANTFDVDHIFRPQIWYVADMAGRIAVDQICLIDDLDKAVAAARLPGLDRIVRLNPSEPLDFKRNPTQLRRLQALYPVDFAIHAALQSDALPGLTARRMAAG